jgi:hypothetical protein
MTLRSQFLLAAALGVVVACASSGGEGTLSADSRLINRAQLDQLKEQGIRNLYEAIERVQPRWLVVRSGLRSFSTETEIVVFQDQSLLGNQDALRRMGVEGVYEIRYLDGATAQATLAGIQDRHVQGAIVVYMRPPR